MKIEKLKNMQKGWFIGQFTPNVLQSKDVEVGIKILDANFTNPTHFHKISTEITCIIEGSGLINGKIVSEGDIITIYPYESTDFKALTDVKLVVIKTPASINDKYDGAYNESKP